MNLFQRFLLNYSDSVVSPQTISKRSAMTDLVDQVDGDSFVDFTEKSLEGMSDIIEDMSESGNFKRYNAEQIKLAASSLDNACIPSETIDSMMVATLQNATIDQLIKQWKEEGFVTNTTDLASKTIDQIATKIQALPCTHPFVRNRAADALADAKNFLIENTETYIIKSSAVLDGTDAPTASNYSLMISKVSGDIVTQIGTYQTDQDANFVLPFNKVTDETDPPIDPPPYEAKFRVKLYKNDGSGEQIGTDQDITIESLEEPVIDYGPLTFEYTAPAPPDTPELAEIQSTLSAELLITLPTSVTEELPEDITLRGIRNLGGLETFYRQMTAPPPLTYSENSNIRQFDRFAQLDFVMEGTYPDEGRLDASIALFLAKYTNPVIIAHSDLATFVETAVALPDVGITEEIANAIYYKATMVVKYASSYVAGIFTRGDNSDSEFSIMSVSEGEDVESVLEANIDKGCHCSDCETAVSPLAYLAALLDYTVKNLYKNPSNATTTLADLTSYFHQPFAELPAECDEVDRLVCQQRLAIEVLRSYMESDDEGVDIKSYLTGVFYDFLEKIGTSYDEIRVLNEMTPADKLRSLSERLGVNNSYNALSYLNIKSENLSEALIERVFGLQDTSKNRLSDGVLIGINSNVSKITKWNIHGVKWNKNTDENGLLYVKIVYASSTTTISLYSNDALTDAYLVASGTLNSGTGLVKLNSLNYSGLKAEIQINGVTADFNFSISLVSKFLSEQLKELYSNWKESDFNSDNKYSNHELPFIDPDLIGVENIRKYTNFTFDSSDNPAAKLWILRREAIDGWYTLLNLNGSTPRPIFGANGMFEIMTGWSIPVLYCGTTLNPTGDPIWHENDPGVMKDWYDQIIAGTISQSDVSYIKENLYLDVDTFKRYMELTLKASMTADERMEYINIQVNCIKQCVASIWITEENTASILMSANFFIADSEPYLIGQFPLQRRIIVFKNTESDGTGDISRPVSVPLIDPDLLSEKELVDINYSANVHSIRTARAESLQTISNDLLVLAKTIPSGGTPDYTSTFRNLIRDVYAKTDFSHSYRINDTKQVEVLFDEVNNDLNSLDSTKVLKAETEIANLALAVTDFKFLIAIRAKMNVNSPISDNEYNSVSAILTRVIKIKDLYNDNGTVSTVNWFLEEAGIPYWKVVKQYHSLWRSIETQKLLWLEALELSKTPSAIDPDVITDLNLILPRASSAQETIFLDRRSSLNTKRSDIITEGPAAADKPLYIIEKITFYTDITSTEFLRLKQKLNEGGSINTRLQQLNFPYSDFEFCCNLYDLASVPVTIQNSEWTTFAFILVNIYKNRNFVTWKIEEQSDNIYFNPLLFDENPATRITNPTVPEEWQQRFDYSYYQWRQIIAERDMSQNSLVLDYNNIISEVEDEQLNLLRDLLLAAIPIAPLDNPMDLDPVLFNANKLTNLLLIDMQNNCCQHTTRVAQAIVTIQNLLWQVRSGQLLEEYPTLRLSSDLFDSQWPWLGSYETWRSYMFVYIYPENLLLPTIRTWQSAAFMEFVDTLRGRSIVSRVDAAVAASKFYDYVKDVSTIEVQASCRGITTMFEKDSFGRDYSYDKELIYMFGKSASNKFYYCTYDATDKSGYGQSDWKVLPFAEANLIKVHGARLYDFWYKPTIHVFYSVWTETNGAKLSSIKIELNKNNNLHESYGWEINADGLLPNDNEGWLIDHENILITDGEFVENGSTGKNRQVGVAYLKTLGMSKILFFRYLKDVTLDDWSNSPLHAQSVTSSIYSFSELYYLKEYTEDGNPGWIYKSYLIVGKDASTSWNPLNILANIHIPKQPGSIPQYRDSLGTTAAIKDASEMFVWRFVNTSMAEFVQGVFYDSATRSVKIYQYDMLLSASHVSLQATRYPSELSLNFDANNQYVNYSVASGLMAPDKIATVIRDQAARYFIIYQNASSNSLPGAFIARLSVSSRLINQPLRIVPLLDKLTYILGKSNTQALVNLKEEQVTAFNNNGIVKNGNTISGNSRINNLIEEAYYFVPTYVADQLQKSGDYIGALDWYQNIYNYTIPNQPAGNRKIYYGLVQEASSAFLKSRAWATDPSNPHNIAATRKNSYTIYTLQNIIRSIIAFADSEFTADTPESVARARTLYMTALDLLEDPLMNPAKDACQSLLGLLILTYPAQYAYEVQDRELRGLLSKVPDQKTLKETIENINEIFESGTPTEQFQSARDLVWSILNTNQGQPDVAYRLTQQSDSALLAVMAAVSSGELGKTGDGEIQAPLLHYVPTLNFNYCVPPNPIADSLRLKANLNLFKIRNCRNIAGMVRELDPYAAPTDAYSGMPTIGENGIINRSSRKALKSSDYRFKIVIARAKELAEMANRLENTLLSFYEKADAENYTILRAKQDISSAKAGVKLQDLRYKEAEDGVELASLEKTLANKQVETYGNWISAGWNEFEITMLGLYSEISVMQSILGYNNAAAQTFSTYANTDVKYGWAAGFAAILYFTGAGLENRINTLNEKLQSKSLWASRKRREDEWNLQLSLAKISQDIGDQKIKIANDQVRIAGQEKKIAELQTDHSEQSLEFLRTKFTNADLYEWMSKVIARTYVFFLDQATAVARLASDQLYFERQSYDAPPILSNYYDAPIENAIPGTNQTAPDRRGLTGSYRLIQDIAKLEQYAFETDKRKLQLSKTISLSREKTIEFQDFKVTGELNFATLLSDFDKDFPGHYLRLIKRVKVSVIALVPPVEGIKAMLTCVGNSNVVIKNEERFEKSKVSRAPESIALTGANNSAGLFEMDMQPNEFLFPFEGIGVETLWSFTLPRASNHFDFGTIADVLVTIEYTALEDTNYRSEMCKQLDSQLVTNQGDVSMSLRNNFADQWYDLHNSATNESTLSVSFETFLYDFPVNIKNMAMSEYQLYFVTEKAEPNTDGEKVDINATIITLNFKEKGKLSSIGGEKTCVDSICKWPVEGNGVIPHGTWTLLIPTSETIRNLFTKNKIKDIILIISLKGGNEKWPSSYKLGK